MNSACVKQQLKRERKRAVQKATGWQFTLKGQDKATQRQSKNNNNNTEIFSMVTARAGCIQPFPCRYHHDWAELNGTEQTSGQSNHSPCQCCSCCAGSISFVYEATALGRLQWPAGWPLPFYPPPDTSLLPPQSSPSTAPAPSGHCCPLEAEITRLFGFIRTHTCIHNHLGWMNWSRHKYLISHNQVRGRGECNLIVNYTF